MAMIACYTMINDTELANFKTIQATQMLEHIENLNETHEILDIDKIWDGLHFLLTGASASEPIEGDTISEAIVGVTNLNEESFIACTTYLELEEIVESLGAIDFPKLINVFKPSLFGAAEIYPNIWFDGDKESLFSELEHAFNDLLVFYQQAYLEKMNVIVSIY